MAYTYNYDRAIDDSIGIPIVTWAGKVWPEVPLEGGIQNLPLPRLHSIHKLSRRGLQV